jgi:mannonate dehydratase
MTTIEDIKVFVTTPARVPLVVVKVETSEPGLYGLGCATFSWKYEAVVAAIRDHLKPGLVGRGVHGIEDIWHAAMTSGYWRNGPVLNNAVSGIDMALWDIKGKIAGLPCYQLWGGKCRPAATVYVHANGTTPEEVADKVSAILERGFSHVRCQMGGYRGTDGEGLKIPPGGYPGEYYDPREKLNETPRLFEHLRKVLGDRPELLHDVHERMEPNDAIRLAERLAPYDLFFLEDPFAPEDAPWLEQLRNRCSVPIAFGELFSHPNTLLPLITNRLFDYLRLHPSEMGGVTPCLKWADVAAAFGIRTAWHGPGDVSPVGMAANVHMDVAKHNFGIQEWGFRSDLEHEMFPGIPEVRDGAVWPNEKPGWGIEFDEDLAVTYPSEMDWPSWTKARRPDGTYARP